MHVPVGTLGKCEPLSDRRRAAADRLPNTCTSRWRGTCVKPAEERQHVLCGVALAGLMDDLAGTHVQGREGSTVSLRLQSWVIVRARPGFSGTDGWVRSNA